MTQYQLAKLLNNVLDGPTYVLPPYATLVKVVIDEHLAMVEHTRPLVSESTTTWTASKTLRYVTIYQRLDDHSWIHLSTTSDELDNGWSQSKFRKESGV